jgi:hypothetical protein
MLKDNFDKPTQPRTCGRWVSRRQPCEVSTRQQADLQGDHIPGLILHKMLFFRLPYNHDDTFSELEREIATYGGWVIGYFSGC